MAIHFHFFLADIEKKQQQKINLQGINAEVEIRSITIFTSSYKPVAYQICNANIPVLNA